ncbi:PQQ-binding-like beta-propeller repeat protein [Conexibacter sp. SYSU D00693]|uniref:PQQ-binding-like beta-propeller repeat protein n=1 Tax=Conexibacter sp. SYSU D00693 TaxID=2812560 RepID=UPI00196A4625|nr:PQQ-binding-like beta-propeller repeat protein [Conexibacter sp. SYSU D00693]
MSRSTGGRRRRLALAFAAVGVVAFLLGALAVVLLRDEGNVSNPDVAFEAEPPPTTTTPTRAVPGRDPWDDDFEWPVYGYTKARTKYLPVGAALRPPFVETWKVTGRILLEFPPVLCGQQLFLLKNNGALYGISRRTGRVRWKRKLGYLAASSPACSHGTVYVTLLQRGRGVRAGRVVAVRARSGATRWSRKLPSRSETSPLLDDGRLYLGSEDGTVYAMRAGDGAVRWRYKAGGAVKGALALSQGKLFFGDYAGQVTALRRADGRRLWRTGTSGSALGLKSGNFYATPAVAYGRVYLGNTDGFVYSFSARDGKLAWRHKTGGFVYSSPAVSPVRGGTVYAGSYDGKLYAFDARSGDVRWTRDTGGKISGGPQVVGDLVLYSNLSRKSTGAVGAATGDLVWSTGRGAFNPAISDGRRIYLVGYSSLFALTTRKQARRDRAALRGTAAGRAVGRREADRRRARAERARKRAVGRRVARRKRALARRVAERQRKVARRNDLRRRGVRFCFRSGGKRVCRLPRPMVCFKRPGSDATVCRTQRPKARSER